MNQLLMSAGMVLLCAGLYRESPLKLNANLAFFLVPVGILFLATLGLTMIPTGNAKIVPWAVKDFIKLSSSYLPLLLILFGTMALSGRLTAEVYRSQIEVLLRTYGSFGAIVASMVTPSSSVASRIVDEMWKTPDLRTTLITFLMASPLLSVSIATIRLMGIENKTILLKTYGVSLVASVLMIPIIKAIGLLFEL